VSIAGLPYLHAAGDGGPRTVTQMIVIHATDNTASAESEAAYATRRPDRTSAHIYVDNDSAVRALPMGNVAYGCYPTGNLRSIQFELTGLSNHISDATMRQAAPLVAEVCHAYGIPIRKIGPNELVAGTKGICGHGDVTAAWHQGDHTDPGASFPWSTFIGYVQAAATPPTPEPPPTPHDDEENMDAMLKSGDELVVMSPTTEGGTGLLKLGAAFGDAVVRVAGWREDSHGWVELGQLTDAGVRVPLSDSGRHWWYDFDDKINRFTIQNAGPGTVAVAIRPHRAYG
jgi:hypothetical protein